MAWHDSARGAVEALARADARLVEKAAGQTPAPARHILSYVGALGDQPQLRVASGAVLAAGLITGNKRLRRAGVRMLLAHELATSAKDALKRRLDRTRPRSAGGSRNPTVRPGRASEKEKTSFPSGHSAGATAASLAFAREFPEHRPAAFGAAFAIAAAQVPRRAHYASDVLAGMLIGAAVEAATDFIWVAAKRQLASNS